MKTEINVREMNYQLLNTELAELKKLVDYPTVNEQGVVTNNGQTQFMFELLPNDLSLLGCAHTLQRILLCVSVAFSDQFSAEPLGMFQLRSSCQLEFSSLRPTYLRVTTWWVLVENEKTEPTML